MLEQSTDTGITWETGHNAWDVDDKVKEIRQNAVFICDNGFTENVEKSLEMQTESDLNIVKPWKLSNKTLSDEKEKNDIDKLPDNVVKGVFLQKSDLFQETGLREDKAQDFPLPVNEDKNYLYELWWICWPLQAKKGLWTYTKCADSDYPAHAQDIIWAFTHQCYIL